MEAALRGMTVGDIAAEILKGNILIGILATWVLGMLCQLAGLYVPDPKAGFKPKTSYPDNGGAKTYVC